MDKFPRRKGAKNAIRSGRKLSSLGRCHRVTTLFASLNAAVPVVVHLVLRNGVADESNFEKI